MIRYEIYKLIHYTGLFLILSSLGGIAMHMINGGARDTFLARRWAGALHGVGMFMALLGGFGMYARAYSGMPLATWVWIKVFIWLVLGAAPFALYRIRGASRALFLAIVALAVAAAATALHKPFSDDFGATEDTQGLSPAANDVSNDISIDDDSSEAAAPDSSTPGSSPQSDDPNLPPPEPAD
ncbi:MAG: hypothetical protein NDI61_03320 [Bdellovibrionaceae bacterium]|nr:hypothetical protein [Pseudobdellovibrionaceae bacterium]